MKIPAIKQLVENHDVPTLQQAEEAIINEEKPSIEIIGEDEGEQLTHVLAAIWILQKLDEDKTMAFKDALRAYTSKVRNSIN